MANMYVVATRKSYHSTAYDEVVNYNFRLGVCEAVVAASHGSARSVFWDGRLGSLEKGKVADLTVWDMEWDEDKLLSAVVQEMWFKGEKVWEDTST
jgi:predicted amidohydrolase YtcJ